MPAFVNNYKEPEINIELSLKGPESYDLNFNTPVPQSIETDRIKLVPFIPAVHGEAYIQAASVNPNLTHYIPVDMDTHPELLHFNEKFFRSDPGSILFAIIDKTKPNHDVDIKNSIAGMIGLLGHSTRSLITEIAPVIIVPAYQRTFAATNAVGALLRWCLDLPAEGGLGFRRVSWSADPGNAPSLKIAERMGFKRDGIMRWTWTVPAGKGGTPVPGRGELSGRNCTVLSICWDDWENGVKDSVAASISRQS